VLKPGTSGFREYGVPTAGSFPALMAAGSDGKFCGSRKSSADKVSRVTTSGAFTEFNVPTSTAGPFGITSRAGRELVGNRIRRQQDCEGFDGGGDHRVCGSDGQ